MGWDVPETARRLHDVVVGPVASVRGLIKMIYAWERDANGISERYLLAYRKLGLGEQPTADPDPDSDHESGPISGLLDKLAGEAVEFGRRAESATVGAGTIEQLDDAVHRLSREYLTSPPVQLIRRAAGIRSRVFALLGEHQRLSYTRDLYVVAAKCCAFLSWAAGDLGQLGAAAAEGRTALILADEAGHPGAQALAYCALSKTAYWDGHIGRAASLARQGYERCPPNSTKALLACQEADALPVAHARDSINRARRAYEDVQADDDLAGLFSIGAVRLANYTVTFHLHADENDAAITAAAVTPPPGEQVGYGTWSQLRIGAAIAELHTRQLDAAADRLAPVLALPAWLRLATLTTRLSALPPVLDNGVYRRDPSAATLAEQIRAYCVEGASQLALPAGRGD